MNQRNLTKRILSMIASFGIVATTAAVAAAQGTANYPVIGNVHRNTPQLDALIDPEAKIEVVASGFDWSEGPVWSPGDGGGLLFSDVPANTIFRWQNRIGVDIYMQPSGFTGVSGKSRESGSNGLAFDAQGRLVLCEHGDRRVSVLTKGGGKMTLTDNFEGKRFNSPNDLVIHSDGAIFFTDPPYGVAQEKRELDFCGVYRLDKDAGLQLLTNEFTRPNGIALSPDERTLYIAQSDPKAALWKAFPLAEDGTLGEGRILRNATEKVPDWPGLPDGLKVDTAGNIWASGPGGVWVMNPDGKLLGRIDTGERISNVGWGDDGSTLYMTSDMYLCRVRTKAKGLVFRGEE
ncbi:SMP-30/gluconolactonase/LRE family protein [Stratiformator vulcanicus]|uniref:Gluconolactonase n=1 Tax=Stratiformator vulcanicus TaxID=2527980 RepID=A0A517R397_9PLAN|nr:SMP-30/gluconolactonase/LRE family protein [Stratiformator vulcanicus]QDT38350.1 Gluconolactonase precursor [Stratiformator vulcanicus]